MQLLFSSKTRAILAAAAVLVCLSHRCFADPITLTSSALSTMALDPSADTISLNAGSTTFASGSGATIFQTGDFIIGNSADNMTQIIPFSFDDTVTLNGITEVLDIFGQDDVTSTADTLSIFAGTPTLFGDEVFTLDALSVTGDAMADFPIEMQAAVAPTPEPNTLLLLATGVLAIIVLAPATRRSFGSSSGSVPPPVNFIKMPVPARSWVQRGASFHPAAPDTVQAQQPAEPASDLQNTGGNE